MSESEWDGLSEISEDERRHRQREDRIKRRKLYTLGGILSASGLAGVVAGFAVFMSNPGVGFLLFGLGAFLVLIGVGCAAQDGTWRLRSVGTMRGPGGSRVTVVRPTLTPPDEVEELREKHAKEAVGYFESLEDEPDDPAIKVRCLKCRNLNEEKAHYCSECGAVLQPTE